MCMVIRTRETSAAVPSALADAVAELTSLQGRYVGRESVTKQSAGIAPAEALQAICELDLAIFQAIEPRAGFGKD